jgi:hypothetical protein
MPVDPAVGRVVEVAAEPGRRGEAAHQDEERQDRELVVGDGGEDLPGEGVERGGPGRERDGAEEARDQNCDADRRAGSHQREHEEEARDPDRRRGHGALPDRMAIVAKIPAESAKARASTA